MLCTRLCQRAAVVAAVSFTVTSVPTMLAATPQLVSYQGRLTDADEAPLNGDFAMTFTIYDDSLLSSQEHVKWQETHATVSVAGGLFDVLLGSVAELPASVFVDTVRYLGIRVGADPEVTPRTRLATVPYAFRSSTVDGATGGTISGALGIDVASPEGQLDVAGQSVFRRGEGIQDRIIIGVNDPNVALELRSGSSSGTPYIDFANDDVTDYDARIRLREDGLLGIEGLADVSLQVDGHLVVYRTELLGDEPSEDLDVVRSYYTYKGSAASPFTYQGSAVHAKISIGGDGSNPVGTGHGISSESVMLEAGSPQNEMTPLYLGCVAHVPCRLWGVDLSVHGPVSAQADLIQGLVNFVNNYNVAAVPNKGVAMAIVTRPGAGGSATAEQQISQTYPLDAGLAIVGYSGTPGGGVKTQGFETALQIGGSGSGWMQDPETSKIGTGIRIKEIESAGIEFQDFLDLDAPAMLVGVPNVMQINEGGVSKWKLSQEGAGVGAALLLRDLTEVDEWWWGCMAGGDKRLSFQNDRVVVMRDGKVGIGTPIPGNILTVVQDSPTDPIADSWTVYSSRRWKENVAPIPDALEKVKGLTGVRFDWKGSRRHDIGMIAEDVGQVLPEVVTYEAGGTDAVAIDYARLTALLIEAVKEQQKAIEQLQAQVSALATEKGLGRVETEN